MDDMMIIIGNHTLVFSTADEIIDLITEISGDSILNYFFEEYYNGKKGLSTNPQGVFIMPYVEEKYLNSNDQFSKEGFVSFRGVIYNNTFQIDIGTEYYLFFPGFAWALFHLTEDIYPEIYNFSVRFLSKMGSSEFIIFPDLNSIAEFVSGKINTGTYELAPIKIIENNPPPSSPFKDNCNTRLLTFNQIKQRIQKYMGKPASRWIELVFTEDYTYLLEKIPSSYKY